MLRRRFSCRVFQLPGLFSLSADKFGLPALRMIVDSTPEKLHNQRALTLNQQETGNSYGKANY